MWIPILILVAVIFLLKNISASHKAAKIPTVTKTPASGSTPTAGDSFCSGKTFVPGVPEPCLNCTDRKTLIPIHLVFPVAPPPIAIQQPRPVRPIPEPVYGGGDRPIVFMCEQICGSNDIGIRMPSY